MTEEGRQAGKHREGRQHQQRQPSSCLHLRPDPSILVQSFTVQPSFPDTSTYPSCSFALWTVFSIGFLSVSVTLSFLSPSLWSRVRVSGKERAVASRSVRRFYKPCPLSLSLAPQYINLQCITCFGCPFARLPRHRHVCSYTLSCSLHFQAMSIISNLCCFSLSD